MEILEFSDVLSSVMIEEIKRAIFCRQIAFGKFINGYSCIYLHVNQEQLNDSEDEFTASYIINKKGSFLNVNIVSDSEKKTVDSVVRNDLCGLGPIDIKRIVTYSSENDFVDLDAFFENRNEFKFDYTDYIILSHLTDKCERVGSLFQIDESFQLKEIYSGNLNGITNYAFKNRYLFLKSELEDNINPNDCYDEYFLDDMDYNRIELKEEVQKTIYATKYGIFDLNAKTHLIYADGHTSFTNSANGFPNVRICNDEISFCNKLISSEFTYECGQKKGYTKKVWSPFTILDKRNYKVEIFDPFSSFSKNIFYTDNYYSFCRYKESKLFGKDYYNENKTIAFELYFAKPAPCVVVDLREYTLEAETGRDFFGRVIHAVPGIFYIISQGKYTGMNILWMLEKYPEKIIELIDSGYLYLLHFERFSNEFYIEEDYKMKIQRALSLAISYSVIENMTDHLKPLFAFSNYYEPEFLEYDNSNKTFENMVLFKSSFIIELLQNHSLYIESQVIEQMKQKYNGKKRIMTILAKIEKENVSSEGFINRELERLEEQDENWRQESLYEEENDFYENDTTWYEGDSDAQWNID